MQSSTSSCSSKYWKKYSDIMKTSYALGLCKKQKQKHKNENIKNKTNKKTIYLSCKLKDKSKLYFRFCRTVLTWFLQYSKMN